MAEVYAALKSLQNELSETSFRRSLQHFMAWIKGKSKPLAKYFEKEYVGRTREWAACFRVGSRANTMCHTCSSFVTACFLAGLITFYVWGTILPLD